MSFVVNFGVVLLKQNVIESSSLPQFDTFF